MEISDIELVKVKEFQRSRRVEVTYRIKATQEEVTESYTYPATDTYKPTKFQADLMWLAYETQFPILVYERAQQWMKINAVNFGEDDPYVINTNAVAPEPNWRRDPATEEEALARWQTQWAQAEALAAQFEPPAQVEYAQPPVVVENYPELNIDWNAVLPGPDPEVAAINTSTNGSST